MWGEARERVMSDLARWADLLHPDDRERAAGGMPRLLAGETYQQTYRIVRSKDGAARFIQDTGFPIRDESGWVRRVAGIAQDVTEARQATDKIRRSERRLRALVEGIPQLVWRAVGGGEWTWSSPQWSECTGLAPEESRSHGWLQARPGRSRAGAGRLEAGGGNGRAGGRVPASPGVRRPPSLVLVPRDARAGRGGQDRRVARHLHRRGRPAPGRAGRDGGRAPAQDPQPDRGGALHRGADHGPDRTGPGEAFRAQFNDRLGALSRVQGLLSRASEEPITIGALVHLELDALGAKGFGDRIVLDGPEVPLRNSVVQTLALALHELATNALKYGALATDRGVLKVTWSVRQADGAGRRLALEWLEDGLDRAREEQSPARKGYGRELIEHALPYALGAKKSFELDERNVRCTIELPLAKPGGSRDRA
jgi:two-component sensor histidine kinase/PAS domain-containing protein